MATWQKLEVERAVDPRSHATMFRLKGVLTDSDEGLEFFETVRAEARAKPGSIVINLRDVDYITSAGVGVLASCYTSAMRSGANLALAELQTRPRAELRVVRLLTVIPEFETEQAALAAVTTPTQP